MLCDGQCRHLEIYTLMEATLRNGQSGIDMHVFPFRFDTTKIVWQNSDCRAFLSDLRVGFEAFNRTGKSQLSALRTDAIALLRNNAGATSVAKAFYFGLIKQKRS